MGKRWPCMTSATSPWPQITSTATSSRYWISGRMMRLYWILRIFTMQNHVLGTSVFSILPFFNFYLFIILHVSIYIEPVIGILILNLICLNRNAYQEHCMGSYGGPVLPHVALGGFLAKNQTLSENPNYMLADTLVITLPINNFFNTSMLKPALAWEKV